MILKGVEMTIDIERITQLQEIDKLMNELNNSSDQANESERSVVEHLWNLRGKVPVDAMGQATGWSRQTIYNKWNKHGFKSKSRSE